MTIMEAKQKLVNWCCSQVGYHESWDGSNKYGADGDWDMKLYGFDASNVAWCDVFCDFAFIHNFGYELGTQITFQQDGGSALCRASAQKYKHHGHWFVEPEIGDQIFFYYGGEINHTGIVVSVDGDQISCVEGNYSDGVGRTYYNWRISNQIAGYGRPDWGLVTLDTDEPIDSDPVPDQNNQNGGNAEPVEDNDRHYLELKYGDGLKPGLPRSDVKAWQNLMLCWGLNVGADGADGEFGLNTKNATIQFQNKLGLTPTGEVGDEEWKQAIWVGR